MPSSNDKQSGKRWLHQINQWMKKYFQDEETAELLTKEDLPPDLRKKIQSFRDAD